MKAKNKLIIQQTLRIAELEAKVLDLEDTAQKRADWIDKAKRDAGAELNESFDRVWERSLAALKASQA